MVSALHPADGRNGCVRPAYKIIICVPYVLHVCTSQSCPCVCVINQGGGVGGGVFTPPLKALVMYKYAYNSVLMVKQCVLEG